MSDHASVKIAVSTPPDLAIVLPELTDDLACPLCRAFMEVHQPDRELPDRLLGTCAHCRAWTLVELGVDGRASLTLLIRPTGSG